MNKQQQLMKQIIDRAVELNMSQEDVSKACSVPKGTVSRNWTGTHPPSLKNVVKYAKGLNFKIVLE
jgi:transcriptional regulator with XRE-family HTH domain